MTSPTTAAANQSYAGYEALSTFLRNFSTSLGTSGAPVDFGATMSNLVSDEALSFFSSQKEKKGSFQAGASMEAASAFAAILREDDIAKLGKVALINAAVSDLSEEADFYANSGQFLKGVMGGAITDGSFA